MTGRIFLKLIAAVLGLLAISLFAVDFMASRIAESTYQGMLTRELEEKCRMMSTEPLAAASNARIEALAEAARGRVTVIASDGRVLADSEADAAQMENHATRPEVAAALSGRQGSIRRKSPTMGVDFLYLALPLDGGGAVRLARPLSQVSQQVDAVRERMMVATALAFVPAILIAAWFARYASTKLGAIIDYAGQLAQGNFNARLSRTGPDELGVLSSKLNETSEKLKAMFDELQEEHVELEKVERIRKDFVINVSHELRTPLASIQGYAETLLDGALDDPENRARFVSIIRQNAERLTRLTADLLTLSRVEQGISVFQFAHYYVNGLLRNAMDTLLPLAERKGVHLRLLPAPQETEVFCDSEAVHQILSNLVDNAIKYTPPGGTVTLAAKTVAAMPYRPAVVDISVRDSGIGIPPEDLSRLFERFYRVDKARSREMGGTGLGLAIVKHLTLAQGGEVRVASTVDEGSVFHFTLPQEDLGFPDHGAVQAEITVS